MNLKKILSVLSAFSLAFVFLSACSKSEKPALVIKGNEVTQDIYAYYLDKVISNPSDYGLDFTSGETNRKDEAKKLCKEYVAVTAKFMDLDLSLTVSDKAAVSAKVTDLWRIFSGYYTTRGIAKQTLTNIETFNAVKKSLFLYYFDSKGTTAVNKKNGKAAVNKDGKTVADETDIKNYFYDNYVAYRSINGYLTKTDDDDNTVDLSTEEINALKRKFEALSRRIASGDSIEEVGADYAAEQGNLTVNTDMNIIRRDTSAYPAGFFEEVEAIETASDKAGTQNDTEAVTTAPATTTPDTTGQQSTAPETTVQATTAAETTVQKTAETHTDNPKIIMLEDYIFLVYREDIAKIDESYYQSYRTECLEALKDKEMDRMIESFAEAYKVEPNNDIVNSIYTRLTDLDKQKL